MRFETTSWSQIDAAGDVNHPEHAAAVEYLIRKYWKPVFYFVRARRHSVEEAEDLVQEFFFRICDRHWLRCADPERGRFRTFLLTLLTRFLADRTGRRARRQVQFECAAIVVSQLLKDEDRNFEPTDSRSAESIFLEKWAVSLLERACHDIHEECLRLGRAKWYEAFEACILRESAGRLTQVELARHYGMTRDQLRYALGRMQAQLKSRIREELRLDGCPLEDLDREQSDILRILSPTAESP